jgi:hypothetical protein
MFEKAGKFYSDWRDRQGNRKRKCFNSKRAALQFEAEQKELAHPKLRALGQPLRTCSTPDSKRTAPTIKPRTSSSLRLVQPNPTNSPRPTRSKSTRR